MAITTDADFLNAVKFAKAIALSQAKRELTPNLVLAGFFVMLTRNGTELTDKSLAIRTPALKDACARIDIPTELPLTEAVESRLPLSNALRRLLQDADLSVSQFLDRLLESALPDDSDGALFDLIMVKASAWSRRHQEGMMTAEVLAAAAFFAFKDGAFVDHPAIGTHIALASENLSQLIQQEAWEQHEFIGDDGPPLTLEAAQLERIDTLEVPRVFAIIDLGSTTGARIAAQRSTAYHEAGHAVASVMLRPQVPITQVSIIGISGAEGRTAFDWNSSYISGPSNRGHFKELLQILLAGGIAEQLQYGDDHLDEGALSDIQRATSVAWNWVAKYGLDEGFGPLSLSAIVDEPGYAAGYLSNEAQRVVQSLLKTAREETRSLLQGNWHYVESLAALLLERKALGTHEVIEAFIDQGIVDWPGVRKVFSKAIDRPVRFADAPGVCQTMEGPVRYNAGDALVTGSHDEEWPISIDKFQATYTPVGDVQLGVAGIYRKESRSGLAIQLSAPRSVILSDGRGVLRGRKGDWVIDYGGGDLSLVAQELFKTYYEISL